MFTQRYRSHAASGARGDEYTLVGGIFGRGGIDGGLAGPIEDVNALIDSMQGRGHALRTATTPAGFLTAHNRLGQALESARQMIARGRPSSVSTALWYQFQQTYERQRYTFEHQPVVAATRATGTRRTGGTPAGTTTSGGAGITGTTAGKPPPPEGFTAPTGEGGAAGPGLFTQLLQSVGLMTEGATPTPPQPAGEQPGLFESLTQSVRDVRTGAAGARQAGTAMQQMTTWLPIIGGIGAIGIAIYFMTRKK